MPHWARRQEAPPPDAGVEAVRGLGPGVIACTAAGEGLVRGRGALPVGLWLPGWTGGAVPGPQGCRCTGARIAPLLPCGYVRRARARSSRFGCDWWGHMHGCAAVCPRGRMALSRRGAMRPSRHQLSRGVHCSSRRERCALSGYERWGMRDARVCVNWRHLQLV